MIVWDKIAIATVTSICALGVNLNYDLSQAESSYTSGCNNYNIKMLRAADSRMVNPQIQKFFAAHKSISTLKNMYCGDGGSIANSSDKNSQNSAVTEGARAALDVAYPSDYNSNKPSQIIGSNSLYNWAGVVISSKYNKNITKNYIATNFTVPAIKGKMDNGLLCYWTGLGMTKIIQNGVSTGQDAGKIYNNFWWEILDKKDRGMINIRNLPVGAGDKVYSATYWRNGTGYFLLANLTKNKAAFFAVNNLFNPGTDAEIITERPTFSSGNKVYYSNILNFNKVSYSVDVGQSSKNTLLYSDYDMINYYLKDMAFNTLMDNYNYTTFWHSNS